MKRGSRRLGEGPADKNSLSKIEAFQLGNGAEPGIVVDGTVVLIVARPSSSLDIPRRQSFAWSENAEAYAQRLAAERGWNVHEVARAARQI